MSVEPNDKAFLIFMGMLLVFVLVMTSIIAFTEGR